MRSSLLVTLLALSLAPFIAHPLEAQAVVSQSYSLASSPDGKYSALADGGTYWVAINDSNGNPMQGFIKDLETRCGGNGAFATTINGLEWRVFFKIGTGGALQGVALKPNKVYWVSFNNPDGFDLAAGKAAFMKFLASLTF